MMTHSNASRRALHAIVSLSLLTPFVSAGPIRWVGDAVSNLNVLSKTRKNMVESSLKRYVCITYSCMNNLLIEFMCSWEMGAASQALLEWRWANLSSTNPNLFPFPDTLPEDYAEDVLHIAETVLSKKDPQATQLTPDGSSADPASEYPTMLGWGVVVDTVADDAANRLGCRGVDCELDDRRQGG